MNDRILPRLPTYIVTSWKYTSPNWNSALCTIKFVQNEQIFHLYIVCSVQFGTISSGNECSIGVLILLGKSKHSSSDGTDKVSYLEQLIRYYMMWLNECSVLHVGHKGGGPDTV